MVFAITKERGIMRIAEREIGNSEEIEILHREITEINA